MVLHELGKVDFAEPFPKLRAYGLIIKDGAKMSKSRGNVVIPDAYIRKWGADTLRMYLMFLGPFQEGGDFRDTSIVGVRRFLDKLWTTAHEAATHLTPGTPGLRPGSVLPAAVERKLHQTIKKVSADTERLDYNTAISAMTEDLNTVREGRGGARSAIEPPVGLGAPYAPPPAQEPWARLRHE